MLYNYIVISILGWMVFFHPFYISVTDINYNEKSESLEVAQKIFWDDFEDVLSEQEGNRVDFLNPENPQKLEKLVEKYLIDKNHILVNGDTAQLSYIGYEIEEDAAWFYMEAKKVSRPHTVMVKNEILIHYFPDQRNMVNFYVNKSPKTLILYKDHESGTLAFE
ncbi:DUF6702 family protein [Echinicola sp. 20G]|uniref:DUF6702 family protein n=1 Tax=Echinicola sp. 20G TaxID=2781961 RepID=UPI001910EF38|nr:DUF6702 family protein [Echinicola sp. 20G]